MILFVSDIHFGQGTAAEERSNEADLIACLRSFEDTVEGLYLVGDVFDEYIEYRYLIPKGFVRFQAFLASWTERGVPITYLVGNHDPWHRDYFEIELGVRVSIDEVVASHYGKQVYLAHGDGLAKSNKLYRRLKPILRHPIPVWMYRSLLPGDVGFKMARWYNRRFGNKTVNPTIVEELRAYAQNILQTTPADIVVMGHSHQAERHSSPDGVYLNTGSWADKRTFGCMDEDGIHLRQWNGVVAEGVGSR